MLTGLIDFLKQHPKITSHQIAENIPGLGLPKIIRVEKCAIILHQHLNLGFQQQSKRLTKTFKKKGHLREPT